MPMASIGISLALSDKEREELAAAISEIVAHEIGKPEKYVMVRVSRETIVMSGAQGEAAFVDIRSIGGLSKEVNQRLTAEISAVLLNSYGIEQQRVYVTCADVERTHWGWNGTTFG